MTNNFKKIQFKPLSAGAPRTHRTEEYAKTIAGRTNDILLYGNPDRGYRTTMPLLMEGLHPDPDDPTKTSDTCDIITRNPDGSVVYNKCGKCAGKHRVDVFYENLDSEAIEKVMDYLFTLVYFRTEKTDFANKLILVQAGLDAYGKVDVLPDHVFEVFDLFFKKCRERKCKVLFRYGYHCVQLNWRTSEENRKKHEAVNANEETMIKHINQLAPLITKNIDIIHKWSSGVIGSGGEMVYDYQYPVVNYDTIIKEIVEKVCVPNNITFSVRVPRYKTNLLENEPDYKYARVIGHNNDAIFGEQEHYGWNCDCYQVNHNFDVTGPGQCEEHDLGGQHRKNNQWEYLCETAAYTPQSGEMYHETGTTLKNRVPSGMEMIKQMAHHRHTTISHWNSYIETGFEAERNEKGQQVPRDSVMQRWIDNETVTPEMLDAEGIIYDPAWFCDDNGNLVHRNPYEYIRDHLGYKVQAQDMTLEGDIKAGENVKAEIVLKNYGFAAAFNIESGYMILDKDYSVVSEVKAGEPEKWYSHDPENWKSTEVLEHTVTADITLPAESGKYYLAFYMRNTMEDYAKLSNNMDYIKDKYNILYELEI